MPNPLLFIFTIPLRSLAAMVDSFNTFFTFAHDLVNALTYVIVSLSIVYFLWGIVKWMIASENEEERLRGRQMMLHGVVSIFVMVSIWGFVNLLYNALFDTSSVTPPNLITLPTKP